MTVFAQYRPSRHKRVEVGEIRNGLRVIRSGSPLKKKNDRFIWMGYCTPRPEPKSPLRTARSVMTAVMD